MQNVCKFSSLSFLDKAAVSSPYRALLFPLLPACFQLLWAHPTLYSTGLWLPPPSLIDEAPQHAWWSHWKDSSTSLCKPRAHSRGFASQPAPHLSNRLLDPSAFPGTKAGGLSNKGEIAKKGSGQITASPQSCRWKDWAHDLLTKERRAVDPGNRIMSPNRSWMKRKGAGVKTPLLETEGRGAFWDYKIGRGRWG